MYKYNCTYIFNGRIWRKLVYFSVFVFLCSACTKDSDSYELYWVDSDGNPTNTRWEDYLIKQLNHRTDNQVIAVAERPSADNCLHVKLNVDNKHDKDYSVALNDKVLQLTARDDSKMLWLIYQFIAGIDDNRINNSDLPPAMISMEGCKGNFAFEYRGIYSQANSNPETMPITASHNVDYDWGLWGHNLHKVFEGSIPEEVFAKVNDKRTSEQFCFSSDKLYKAIESYVIDNYGEGNPDSEPVRFAIMPNDNETVCTCSLCKSEGNTSKSATPAVCCMLRRLAERFPHHLFFTSAYLSTYTPPSRYLPSNAGVIISAMEVPMKANIQPAETNRFTKLTRQWNKATGRIYIWDYMRNFDDYLTPYPCLMMIKERLRYFHSLGVSGIMYNGNGNDYAAFDDVQTATIACLLINPDMPVKDYITRYINHFYHASCNIIAKAYNSWENQASGENKILSFYGGIEDAVKSWLNPEEFEAFCNTLDQKSKEICDEERGRLNKLLTALQFTLLELQRMPHGNYDISKIENYLESLRGHKAFKCMNNYREANGSLENYISEWENLISENKRSDNALKGVMLIPNFEMDADYTDVSLLTDGFYAMPSDYHTGWFIASSDEVRFEIPSGKVQNGLKMELSFLYAPSWRIILPASIEIRQSGKCLQNVLSKSDEDKIPFTKHRYQFLLRGIDTSRPLEIRIIQGKGHRPTIACDEIKLY